MPHGKPMNKTDMESIINNLPSMEESEIINIVLDCKSKIHKIESEIDSLKLFISKIESIMDWHFM